MQTVCYQVAHNGTSVYFVGFLLYQEDGSAVICAKAASVQERALTFGTCWMEC